LLNFGAAKKEEHEDRRGKNKEKIAPTKESMILFEKDKGIDRLADNIKAIGIPQGSKGNTGSATDPLPNLPQGQEYLHVIESLQTL